MSAPEGRALLTVGHGTHPEGTFAAHMRTPEFAAAMAELVAGAAVERTAVTPRTRPARWPPGCRPAAAS